MSVFLDTCIPMYAAGKEHPFRKSCREIVTSAAAGELHAWTDAEVFQEILYRFFHIGNHKQGFQLFDSFYKIMEGHILPVTAADISLARELAGRHSETRLSPRDFIHLAVMLNNGINQIITADREFSVIRGIQVIIPTTTEELK